MASFTFSTVAELFPVSTSVSVYPRAARKDGQAPSGPSVASASVASGGSLAFSGLADETAYTAYASVGGVHRYRDFTTAPAPTTDERVVTLESDVAALEAADSAFDTRVDSVESDVAALVAADVLLDGRLDAVEAADTALDTRVDALEGATLDARLDVLEARNLTATTTWNPASTNNDAVTTTTVTVTGAAVGDAVSVGLSTVTFGGVLLFGAVTAADTVTVTLLNKSGSTVDLASGTLRAVVQKW